MDQIIVVNAVNHKGSREDHMDEALALQLKMQKKVSGHTGQTQ